jgi:ABC-2 type transport system permease protein
VLSALAIAALVVMFRAARPSSSRAPEGFQNFSQFVASLNAPSSPWLPSEWTSEAIMGWLAGGVPWSAIGRLWGAVLVLGLLGGMLHARGWARGFSLAQEGAHRAGSKAGDRPWLDRASGVPRPLRRQLVMKEVRVFARDSTQWSQLVMLAVLMVVYVANVRYLPLSGPGRDAAAPQPDPVPQPRARGLRARVGRRALRLPQRESRGTCAVAASQQSAPVRDLLWAKFWTGAAPLMLLALVLVGLTNSMLGVRPFVQVVSLSAVVGLVPALTSLALAYGTFYPRLRQRERGADPDGRSAGCCSCSRDRADRNRRVPDGAAGGALRGRRALRPPVRARRR